MENEGALSWGGEPDVDAKEGRMLGLKSTRIFTQLNCTIVTRIVHHCDREALVLCALVCRDFRRPCQQALLTNIDHLNLEKRRKLMTALIDQLAPGPYRVGLQRFPQNIMLVVDAELTLGGSQFELLVGILPHLTNLKSLTIRAWDMPWDDVAWGMVSHLVHHLPNGFERMVFHMVWVRHIHMSDFAMGLMAMA
jgi:hypothetical protein